MGIRDALKSLRGGEKSGGEKGAGGQGKAEQDITEGDAPEPTWFQPRFDGSYLGGADTAGPGAQLSLRFLPGGRVFESTASGTPGADGPPGPEEENPCRGEYTAAGRFNVQRKFERIISYAILEMEPTGFFARRINGADRSTIELHFLFRPDVAPVAAPTSVTG